MAQEVLEPLRKELLAPLKGRVLEVVFGTGLNLPFYPKAVTELDLLEPDQNLIDLSNQRLKQSGLSCKIHQAGAEKLPFGEEEFDHVITSWTLCSIAELPAALAEMHRVLKASGSFHFIEHGLSSDPKIKFWQNLLTPIQKRVGQGCHLNRDYRPLIESAGFTFKKIEVSSLKGLPSLINPAYIGVAVKA